MGKILDYKHGESSVSAVDERLWDIVQHAIAAQPYDVIIRSGSERGEGDKGNHSGGYAVDITMIDKDGKTPLKDSGPTNFAIYERYAQAARVYQMATYPELNRVFRWGGGFRQGGTPLDLMHLDITPSAAGVMAYYNWNTGPTPAAYADYPGLVGSKGLAGSPTLVAELESALAGHPVPRWGIPSDDATVMAYSEPATPGALSVLLPQDAMYGLRLDGKGLGLTQEELAQATGWGQGDQLFSPAGFGALSDPRTVAMLNPQQRLAAINAVITLPKDVFIPLPNLGTPPSATVDDFVPYQTLPPPPIAQLDQPAPGQTFAGQEGGNVITKPSPPTPAAPFTGSRPPAAPITAVDTPPKPLTYEKGKTASGKEVDLGRVVLGSDGSPGAWNLNDKGVAVFVKNPPTVIDYLNAGGIVGDMAAAEVEKAKAAAGEAVTGAADAVKDKAGEIAGGVGGFLGDLLKPRAGTSTGDTGAQAAPTTAPKKPSISSSIVLPLSLTSPMDFSSIGLSGASKPPVITGGTVTVPPVEITPYPYYNPTPAAPITPYPYYKPEAPPATITPYPYYNPAPAASVSSGIVLPLGTSETLGVPVAQVVAGAPVAAPVAAPPPVVMRPVIRDNSPISAGDYTIRWGDTLASISARSGISVADLAAQNGIGNINSIAEGQRLRIGMPPVVARGPVTRGRPAAAPGVAKPAGLAARSKSGPGYVASGPVGTKTPTSLVNAKGKALTLKNTTRYDAAAGKFVPYSYYTAY